jgi:hypothetical protein
VRAKKAADEKAAAEEEAKKKASDPKDKSKPKDPPAEGEGEKDAGKDRETTPREKN